MLVPFIILLLMISECSSTVCYPNKTDRFGYCKEHHGRSCVFMFSGNNTYSEDACLTYVQKNTTECRSLEFPETEESQIHESVLKISSYCYLSDFYTFPAFNITIDYSPKLQWKGITIRFWVRSYNFALCVKFNISNIENANEHEIWELFYDCPWYDTNLIYKTVEIEFYVDDSISGRYFFITPGISYYNKIAKYEKVLYIYPRDISDIEINIEKCDPDLSVRQYVLSWCDCSENTTVCRTKHRVLSDESSRHITLHENIENYYECFYFLVEAVSDDCEDHTCFVSQSPSLQTGRNNTYWINKVNILFLMTAVIIITLSSVVKWKHCKDMGIHLTKSPKVLLLYESVNKDHVKTVISLTEFLRLRFNMDIILDVDKPDPLEWLHHAMLSVDCIFIVVSPKCKKDEESVYRGIYTLALHTLSTLISKKRSNTKIAVLLLPYCQSSDIPFQIKFAQQFHLPKELSKLISHVQNHNSLLCNYYKKLSTVELERNGSDLMECIKNTTNSLSNRHETEIHDCHLIFPPELSDDFNSVDLSSCEAASYYSESQDNDDYDVWIKNNHRMPINILELDLLNYDSIITWNKRSEKFVSKTFSLSEMKL